MGDPRQELAALRAAGAELAKEKEKLAAEIAGWTSQILQRKEVVAQLERTVAELKKPDGEREGLLRCAAELNKPRAPATGSEAPVQVGPNVSREEVSLQCRLAAAVARGPRGAVDLGWGEEDFRREFAVAGGEGGELERFWGALSPEQRLVWELQNPAEHSPRADKALVSELTRLKRRAEAELLLTAAGPPTERERQYRPLLWLQHHDGLDVSYREPTVADASLLMLACRAGFADVVGELLRRGADVNQVNKAHASALSTACSHGSWGCARRLLEAAADPNGAPGGGSLLVRSAGQERPPASSSAALELLLEFRAAPDAADTWGRTALAQAAARGDRAACEALLRARADPGIEDNEGKTALRLATEEGQLGLVQWLAARTE